MNTTPTYESVPAEIVIALTLEETANYTGINAPYFHQFARRGWKDSRGKEKLDPDISWVHGKVIKAKQERELAAQLPFLFYISNTFTCGRDRG